MSQCVRALLFPLLALLALSLPARSASALQLDAATVVDTPLSPPPSPPSNDQKCLQMEVHRTSDQDPPVRSFHFSRGALSDGDTLSVNVFKKGAPATQDGGWTVSVASGEIHVIKPATGSPAQPAASLPVGIWLVQVCIPSAAPKKFGAQTAGVLLTSGGTTNLFDQQIGTATAAARLPISATLVINEINYDSPGTDTDEFIELENEQNVPVNLSGYALSLIDGTSGTTSEYARFALPNVTLPAGGRFVVCGDSAVVPSCNLDLDPGVEIIRNGVADAIALYEGSTLIDSMSYGGVARGFTEGNPADIDDPSVAGSGLSRCPTGSDANDNGTDFRLRPVTPGASNDCGTGGVQISGDLCDTFANLSYTVTGGPDQPLTATVPGTSSSLDLIVGGLSPGSYTVTFSGSRAGGKATLGSASFVIVSGVMTTKLVDFFCAKQAPAAHGLALVLLFGALLCAGLAVSSRACFSGRWLTIERVVDFESIRRLVPAAGAGRERVSATHSSR